MQVVEPYLPETAIGNWPQAAAAATDFALQYGLKDDLAPHELSVALEGQLKKQGLYLKVGFLTSMSIVPRSAVCYFIMRRRKRRAYGTLAVSQSYVPAVLCV
jgi:hypothetical protein